MSVRGSPEGRSKKTLSSKCPSSTGIEEEVRCGGERGDGHGQPWAGCEGNLGVNKARVLEDSFLSTIKLPIYVL